MIFLGFKDSVTVLIIDKIAYVELYQRKRESCSRDGYWFQVVLLLLIFMRLRFEILIDIL